MFARVLQSVYERLQNLRLFAVVSGADQIENYLVQFEASLFADIERRAVEQMPLPEELATVAHGKKDGSHWLLRCFTAANGSQPCNSSMNIGLHYFWQVFSQRFRNFHRLTAVFGYQFLRNTQ